MMKKIVMAFVAALLLAGGAATALAGAKYQSPVTIGSSYAYGSMADARASADSNQFIGCVVTGGSNGTGGYCYAVDSTGTFKMCSVPSAAAPTMLPALESMGSQSYVYFSFDTS